MKSFLAIVIVVAIAAASVGALWPKLTGGATASAPSISSSVPDCEFSGLKTVTKIIDGDTVISEGESIRLLGIDTDERGYPCYSVAKLRLEALILGKEVELECDAEDKDQYGRYLRYIFYNGTNIDLQMVREGLAVARFSPENVKYKTEILAAETAAREAGIGCKWNQTAWTK